jgi:hypothetical protein
MIGPEKRFVPAMPADVRERRLTQWAAALAKV